MEFIWSLQPNPAATAGIAMMYLVIIYWLRHPDRIADRAGDTA